MKSNKKLSMTIVILSLCSILLIGSWNRSSAASSTTNTTLGITAGAFSFTKDVGTTMNTYFGHSPNELSLRINRANLSDDCCFGAFIRGAFFSCGTVTSPEKNYHLEFVVPHLKLSLDMIKLLDEVKLNPKHIVRNGNHIVYFKDSESIEDLLTLMGATNASLELMGIKMQKNMINSVNRKVNFEVANLSRTVEASIQQINAINLIDNNVGLGHLPAALRDVAFLRRDNPEISLKELGELVSPSISRSGVNHRLKRIVEIAEELEK